MKALTLTQPWAEEVAAGHKQWETRSWSTNYRGLIAIHAAKGYPREAQDFAAMEYAIGRIPGRIALGAIIAVARIVDVRPTEEVELEVSGLERLLGDYSWGRYAWQLTDVRRLPEPLACRGALSLWTPPDDVQAALSRFLSAGTDQHVGTGVVRRRPDGGTDSNPDLHPHPLGVEGAEQA